MKGLKQAKLTKEQSLCVSHAEIRENLSNLRTALAAIPVRGSRGARAKVSTVQMLSFESQYKTLVTQMNFLNAKMQNKPNFRNDRENLKSLTALKTRVRNYNYSGNVVRQVEGIVTRAENSPDVKFTPEDKKVQEIFALEKDINKAIKEIEGIRNLGAGGVPVSAAGSSAGHAAERNANAAPRTNNTNRSGVGTSSSRKKGVAFNPRAKTAGQIKRPNNTPRPPGRPRR